MYVEYALTSVSSLAAKKLPKTDLGGTPQQRARGVDLNQDNQPASGGCCK